MMLDLTYKYSRIQQISQQFGGQILKSVWRETSVGAVDRQLLIFLWCKLFTKSF